MLLSSMFRRSRAAPAPFGVRSAASSLVDVLVAIRWQGPPQDVAPYPDPAPCVFARVRIDPATEAAAAPEDQGAPARHGYEVVGLDCGADLLGFDAAHVVRDCPRGGGALAGVWLTDPVGAAPRALRLVVGRRGEGFTDILVLGESDRGLDGLGASMERHHDDGRLEALSGVYTIEAVRPVPPA